MDLSNIKLKDLVNKSILNSENAFYSKGKGKNGILLLHGLGFSLYNLEMFYKYFKLKNYTIRLPLIGGLSGLKGNLASDEDGWMKEVNDHLQKLSKEVENIYVVGFSFGGNLAISLASQGHKKIKGIITLETPIFFKLKISFLLFALQPLLEWLKIDAIKKNRFLYRKNYNGQNDIFPLLPVKTVGRIYKFIKINTINSLSKIKTPCLIIQAKSSDLLSGRSAKYIFKKIQSSQKEIYYVNSDNHDFDLLDEEGRVLVLEKINRFLRYIN